MAEFVNPHMVRYQISYSTWSKWHVCTEDSLGGAKTACGRYIHFNLRDQTARLWDVRPGDVCQNCIHPILLEPED